MKVVANNNALLYVANESVSKTLVRTILHVQTSPFLHKIKKSPLMETT
jgi:hypothetical protein